VLVVAAFTLVHIHGKAEDLVQHTMVLNPATTKEIVVVAKQDTPQLQAALAKAQQRKRSSSTTDPATNAAAPGRGTVTLAEMSILGVARVAQLPPLTNKCGHRTMVNYFPKLNLAFCTCAKCGSSSAYRTIFKQLFHKDYPEGRPWVHSNSVRWSGERRTIGFKKVLEQERQKQVDMVALVRDPYDRLISSWKNKFRCGSSGVDRADRARLVPKLLNLARVPKRKRKDCLSITDFAMAVQQVYLQGDACKLDCHLRPQSLKCFAEIAPTEYRLVTTAKQIGALYPVVFANMSHTHKSNTAPLDIHPTIQAILRQLAGAEVWPQNTSF